MFRSPLLTGRPTGSTKVLGAGALAYLRPSGQNVSKVTDNIDLRIQAAPADRPILLVRGVETEKLSRDAALAIARRYRGDFELIVSGRKIRKMIQIQRAAPSWQEGYRTLEAASFSPWPGWHLRYE